MKLITLNIWGGKVYQDLVEFIKKESKDTDIFCFQEVFNGNDKIRTDKVADHVKGVVTDMYSTLESLLPDFNGYHAESGKFDVGQAKVPYGIAMFVRKGTEIEDKGVYDIFEHDEDIELRQGLLVWNRLLQYVAIPYKNSTMTIFNLHGLYTGGDKDDGSARLLQSERVRSAMDKHSGEKILCGDFNLNPDTKSLTILADGMRNLVKEYNVPTTRSHHYTKDMKFADYMLVSPGIEVKQFEVLPEVVSDHLPLILNFE